MRLWWRYHTVQPGDTLASLSRSYRVPAKSIAAANQLDQTDKALELDAKLVIPLAIGKHPASDTATYARRITRYRVHKGDTVESVAENFGVSAADGSPLERPASRLQPARQESARPAPAGYAQHRSRRR